MGKQSETTMIPARCHNWRADKTTAVTMLHVSVDCQPLQSAEPNHTASLLVQIYHVSHGLLELVFLDKDARRFSNELESFLAEAPDDQAESQHHCDTKTP